MPDRDLPELLREDEAARERALDTGASFLVQAPAGSGKTELLIQRYLALLATVDEPERIVALTFTRKAAGEMRERVLSALTDAGNGVPVDRPHERRTRRLALAALARSDALRWSITDHPARLSMSTFDSLAVALARRAPLSSGLGPRPRFEDDADALHRAAAEAALASAPADDPDWRTFLAHVANDADRAVRLVADLLRRRDQWLRQVSGEDTTALRRSLEAALRGEAESALGATRAAFPGDAAGQIAELADHAARMLAEHADDERRERVSALAALARAGGLPAASVEALPHWRALAGFLLTQGGSFRSRITKNEGFPTDGKGDIARARRERADAMKSLCARLRGIAGLDAALAAASELPAPATGEASWRVVEALLACLRAAVAELRVTFRNEGAVDFVQGNLAALEALGDGDAPSDLLLRIDARIDHLLLDEFQDTSFTQMRLLERLTAGWLGDPARTIFAVGDPMQSIYRFREAEVRLFVQAQKDAAVAGLPVAVLTLRRNFRSQASLVGWSNRVFAEVLGRVNDPSRGAVAFADAAPAADAIEGVEPTLDLCATDEEEALCVVERVRDAQERGAGSIAILVRARSHLVRLLPALRAAGIPFAAIDLDALGDRQAILDLESLAYALSQPDDRVAWLSVLRAPWCGLTLPDLFAVVEAAPGRHAALVYALEPGAAPSGVSEDGRARLEQAALALRPALALRARTSLAARVRGAWLALGGPACLDDALDLDAAERYFAVLAEHERAGDLPDRGAFAEALARLFAAPEAPGEAGVQVMTMHKAKGLEFDTVILPGLARTGQRADAPLLRWRKRDGGLLIAASRPRGGDDDPVYAYLGELERAEADAELGRLLYVACTRARRFLHLVGAPPARLDAETGAASWRPRSGSSLRKLWPGIERSAPPATVDPAAPVAEAPAPRLARLPLERAVPRPDEVVLPPVPPAQVDTGRPPFDWAAETARQVGTLAHRLLARIGADGSEAWTGARIAACEPRIRAELAQAGFDADEAAEAASKVLEVVRRTLADPRGRWLFDPGHEDARSEWALAGIDAGEIVHVVVDRAFVTDGVRWIVDFKTGTHEGADAGAFLDSEAARYRAQLERYARIVAALESRPVKIALYHPLVAGGFRELGAAVTQ